MGESVQLIMSNLSPNGADFLPQFKAIGQSLKKRFFRKPNVSDAVEQYEGLAQELEREEEEEFAAICYIEAAKCQESLQNFIPQANLLIKAAKLYFSENSQQIYFENENDEPTFGLFKKNSYRRSLEQGIACLDQAAKIFKSQGHNALAILILLESGQRLYKEGMWGEALKHYKSAYSLTKTHFTFADQLVAVEKVIQCKVSLTEYEHASKIITDILVNLSQKQSCDEVLNLVCKNIIESFEIIRVLLILILGANSVDVVRFIWTDSSAIELLEGEQLVSYERNKVLTQLKTLVLATQNGSTEEINSVRNQLSPILNETHHILFNVLIQMQM